MFKTNSYFDGKVMSIAIDNADGPATIGAMKAGEYEFGTSTVEYMTVVSGNMEVMLPGETSWKTYKPFETFIVAKDVKFKVKMTEETAYICHYK
ncbi:MAG TPA: pyrimidine/purine nucleoside phosphorylase [Bacteroidales bacterium]|nr:pyrimidine/purine nucleoside phosphorylase [Bacteroidales bacterium]HQQ11753.1 pyrimidine/purine nucleoside phosphorylase [Bacteroidales bacterium]